MRKYLSIILILILNISFNYSQDEILNNGGSLWSTYIGGGAGDAVEDIIIMEDHIYVTGTTESNTGIATNDAWQKNKDSGKDAFIAKYDKQGNKIWSTYYGGNGDDYATSITADWYEGRIVIAGYTSSTGLVHTSGAYQINYGGGSYDAFMMSLDTNGNFKWDSYYGGSGDDRAASAFMLGDKLYIAGKTNSDNLPVKDAVQETKNAGFDGFMAEIKPKDGGLEWATYYGGEGDDEFTDISYNGYIYACGITSSQNSIAGNASHQSSYGGGASDAFFMKIEDKKEPEWVSYFGGSGADTANAVKSDEKGNIYLAGTTSSGSGIATAGAYKQNFGGTVDGFLAKFNANGNAEYSTYYGGSGEDGIYDLVIDKLNRPLILGCTSSGNNISTGRGLNQTKSGRSDAFMAKFREDGDIIFGSYYGGSGDESGLAAALTEKDIPVIAGMTTSSNGLATVGADQENFGGVEDGFISRFLGVEIVITEVASELCGGENFVIEFVTSKKLIPGNIFKVELSDKNGSFINARVIGSFELTTGGSVKAKLPSDIEPGNAYRIRIFASVLGVYSSDNGFDIQISSSPNPIITGDNELCLNGEEYIYETDSLDGVSYDWKVQGGKITSGQSTNSVTIKWTETGMSEVRVTVTEGNCSGTEIYNVEVHDMPVVSLESYEDICEYVEAIELEGGSPEGGKYFIGETEYSEFDPGEFGTGVFDIVYVYTDEHGCTDSASSSIKVNEAPEKPEITIKEDTLISSADTGNQWYLNGEEIQGAADKKHVPQVDGKYSVRVTNQAGCMSEFSDEVDYTGQDGARILTVNSIIFNDLYCENSDTMKIGILNFGNANLVMDEIEIEGQNEDEFKLGDDYSDMSIAANSSDSIEIIFQPDSPGEKHAKLEIRSNAVNSENVELDIEAVKHLIDFSLAQSSCKFDNIKKDSVFTFQINIKNEGTAGTSLSIAENPIDFTVVSLEPDSLKLDGMSVLTLKFNGSSVDGTIDDKIVVREERCNQTREISLEVIVGSGSPDDKIIIQVDSAAANAGDTVSIPVSVDGTGIINNAGINEIRGELMFNASMLDPIPPTPEGSVTGNLRIMPLTIAVPEETATVELKFIANLGNDSVTTLEMRNILPANNVEYNVQRGEFRLLDICYEGGARLVTFNETTNIELSPNPAEGTVNVDYKLIENGLTRIFITNNFGKVVKTILNEDISKGKYSEVVNLKDLSSGLYFIMLRTPTIIKTRTIRVLK